MDYVNDKYSYSLAVTEVMKGAFFDREDFSYSIKTITDDDEIKMLELQTGLSIALALEYSEYGHLGQILIVATDRKHYKIYI